MGKRPSAIWQEGVVLFAFVERCKTLPKKQNAPFSFQ